MFSYLELGPLTHRTVHLCIDMQNVFAEPTPWHTPWMSRIVEPIKEITERRADRTVFTRFMTPRKVEHAHGSWRRYYQRWCEMTLEHIDSELLEIIPTLRRYSPPARIIDKHVYSPFVEPALLRLLRENKIEALVITGAETDVCVLATVLGAIDFGYRVVIARDAICSSADMTHDALLTLYHQRFAEQIEIADTETILASWQV